MSGSPIPVVRGRIPLEGQPEHAEMMNYESGKAEQDARKVPGAHAEPWLNVVDAFEPASRPSFAAISRDPRFRPLLAGRVIDMGAGSCWLTAEASKLEGVTEVVALDMSEKFLTTAGERVIKALGGVASRIRFAASSFEHVPFDAGYFDVAILCAAIHHSLAPIRALLEARRVLRPGGHVIVLEHASSVLGIRRARETALGCARRDNVTEIAYTRGELEYLLRFAGFEEVRCVPLDILTRSRGKLLVRRLLRVLGLEGVFLPAMYAISARRG